MLMGTFGKSLKGIFEKCKRSAQSVLPRSLYCPPPISHDWYYGKLYLQKNKGVSF